MPVRGERASSLPAGITLECLPGYQFLDCMGRSVFGEIWKVRTPSGRTRAVKFISSFSRDEAAITPREYEAVLTLRQLSHPGLACVERVERDQGRLVLVTERAEMSLRDRYEHCRSAGLPGIPRRELVTALRPVAEALDHLDREHQLHHLAIHPYFNLLYGEAGCMLADYGLVQLLWIPAGQPMSQVNPRYAAPELFEERLSHASDQYSLALVYHEMITGHLPHRGTHRQIMEARLKDRQDLDLLQADDRELIARALERDPRRRFPSCAELVQALAGVPQAPPALLAGTGPLKPPPAILPADWKAPARPAEQPPLEQIVNALVYQAMNEQQRVQEFRGLRYSIKPDATLSHRCGAWLPPGVARQKLKGFIRDWKAQIVKDEDEFFIFLVDPGLPRSLWQRLTGGKQGIRIELRLRRGHAPNSKLTEVNIRMEYLGRNKEDGRNLMEHVGPVLLESLRNHMVASSEQRSEERFPFEYPLRVAPVYTNLEAGEVIECRGKDVGYTGIGFYAPCNLVAQHVYLYHVTNEELAGYSIPAAVVRVVPAGDNWFEVGAAFLFSHASQNRSG